MGLFREAVIRKILYLSLTFIASFVFLFVFENLQDRTIAQYTLQIDNQQARSLLGKAILKNLVVVENTTNKIVDTEDIRTLGILLNEVHEELDRITAILNVLLHGGVFVNSLPTNFYEFDEIKEEIAYEHGPDQGYVMEVIDLTPKVIELKEEISDIADRKRRVLEEMPTAEIPALKEQFHIQFLKIVALVLRARETANKIFYDTHQSIISLGKAKKEAIDQVVITRLGMLGFTLLTCTVFFHILFQIRAILQDREEKTANLNEAKQTIEAILDSLPVGVIILNEMKQVVRANAEAARLVEAATPGDILGKQCDAMFCLSEIGQCPFGSGIDISHVTEIPIRTFKGREITAIKSAVFLTFGGERMILEAFMDITQRKEMEAMLKAQQEYSNAILQGVQAGVVVIDVESHTILDMNQSAARIIGVNRDEAIGVVCHEYICPAERGRCPVTDLGQKVDNAVRTLANGISVLKSVVPFQRGDRQYLLESFVDVTERIEIEEKLKRALNDADQANRAKSEFLSRMSHELRTPLNAIIGFSDLLLSNTNQSLSEKQLGQINHIRGAGQHLTQMISEVLDYSKIESGTLTMQFENVSPRPVVEECMTLLGSLALENDVGMVMERQLASLPAILVDRTGFKQVILNILSNAIKYNNQGGTVTITGEQRGRTATLTFKDTGIGIAPDKQGDLFKPFVRLVDKSRKIEGVGVGMTIVKQLVEMMAGTISFESTEGEGTTFHISFPLAEAQGQEPMSYVKNDTGQGKEVVLYVDDDAERTQAMRQLMQGMTDYTLIVRKSVEKAVKTMRLMNPGVVCVDIGMLRNGGEEDVRMLKTAGKTGKTPRILSLLGESDTMRDYENIGIDGWLRSPLDAEHLRRTLDAPRGITE